MNRKSLGVLAVSAVTACLAFRACGGEWSYDASSTTLTYTEGGAACWKVTPSVSGTDVTLTAQAGSVAPANGLLDLSGAVEKWNGTLSGCSVAFADEGTSFASATELVLTNATWLTLLKASAGTCFPALTSFTIGDPSTDLQFGDSTNNDIAPAASNGVFNNGGNSTTLNRAVLIGKDVVVKCAFGGCRGLKAVEIAAQGSLTLGSSAVCIYDGYYGINRVVLSAGGDVSFGYRAFRRSIATGACFSLSAPKTANVTFESYPFFKQSSHMFTMRWDAPPPKCSGTTSLGACGIDFLINSDYADAFPVMKGTKTSVKLASGSMYMALPEDPNDIDSVGFWRLGGSDDALPDRNGDGANGWGYARWYRPEDCGRWTWADPYLVQTNAEGGVEWKLIPSYDLLENQMTFTSVAGFGQATLDLAGAVAAYDRAIQGASVTFDDAGGTFAEVTDLCMTNCPWLGKMAKQSGAAFTKLVRCTIGDKRTSLTFGDGTRNNAEGDPSYAVFSGAASTLAEATVYGSQLSMSDSFHGMKGLRKAWAESSGDLTVGVCTFTIDSNARSITNLTLISGGNITFGGRAVRASLAKNAEFRVVAPPNATVSLGSNYSIFQWNSNDSFKFYWSAPPPVLKSADSLGFLVADWYVDADYADLFAAARGAETTQALVEGQTLRMKLPADTNDVATAGIWRNNTPDESPKCDNDKSYGNAYWWHQPAPTQRILFIGNSFSKQIATGTYSLAKAMASVWHPIDYMNLYYGACTLKNHWDNHDKKGFYDSMQVDFTSAANPFKDASIDNLSLDDILAACDWDVVSIQQGSAKSPYLDTYEPYSGNLVALIREKAPHAKVVFHQTWAYNRTSSNLPAMPFEGDVAKREWMYDAICTNVEQIAEAHDLETVPTGYATQLYRYRKPVLTPEEDLCNNTSSDTYHFKGAGCYLQLMTWCQYLAGVMPRVPAAPSGYDGELLRQCAADAVAATDYRYYGQGTVDFRYGITFLGHDGTPLGEVQSVTNGAFAVPPTPPAREGYYFAGWGKTADSQEPVTSGVLRHTPVYDTATWYACYGEGTDPREDQDNPGRWAYDPATGVFTATNAAGAVEWKLTAEIDVGTLTLTPTADSPAGTALDLFGLEAAYGGAGLFGDVALVFGDPEGRLANVTELYMTNCYWLTKMSKGSGAAFKKLVKCAIGNLATDLTFGDSTVSVSVPDPADAVFSSASNTLVEASVQGRTLTMKNSFARMKKFKSAFVRSAGNLTVGTCAFNLGDYSSSITNLVIVSSGDITFGERALRSSIALNGVIRVTAPPTATVKLGNYSIYQNGTTSGWIHLYWAAPAPANQSTSMVWSKVRWYVNRDYAESFASAAGAETSQLIGTGKAIYMKLPEDTWSRQKGFWRIGATDETYESEKLSNTHGYGTAQWYSDVPRGALLLIR